MHRLIFCLFFACFKFYNSSIKFIRKLKCLIASEQIFITIFLIIKHNEITFEKKILHLSSQAFPLVIFVGMLVVTKVEPTGLGGTINVHFQCNGCVIRSLAFQGSSLVEGSKRTFVGLCQLRENPEAVFRHFVHHKKQVL